MSEEEKEEEPIEKEPSEEEKREEPVARARGPREMTKIICSDCGKEAEVPFKPTEGRPVYCQECFQKHRPPRRY